MKQSLKVLQTFWSQFRLSPLYNAGFADFVSDCGAAYSGVQEYTQADAIESLCYLKGAADMARLACPYMSPSWQIANLLGIAAATFKIELQTDSVFDNEEMLTARLQRLADQYTRELTDLVQKKEKDSPAWQALDKAYC